MAEERARGAAEGEWKRLEDPDFVWESFRPRVGDIVEFETGLVEGHLHSGHYGAYLVTSTRETGEGSLELNGRCVGCNHEEAGKTLSSLLNRKQQPLHLCHSMPCTYEDSEGIVHAIAARWFNCATFEASYMKPWGKLVIKEYLQATEVEEGEAPGGRRRSALKRPAGAASPRRAGPRTAGKGAGLDGAKLRDKLRRLRGRGAGEEAKKGNEVIVVEESEVSEYMDNSDSAEEDGSPELSGEPLSPRTSLAIKDKVKSEPKEPAEGGGKKKKRKRKPKEKSKDKDPGLQLLAQAAQVRQARKEEMSGKESGRKASSTSGKVKELVKVLLGGKKTKSKKKKKNRSRGSAPGGDPDSPGESSEESDREEDASESSSSEILAPLQRKSSKKPGTVLRLLIQHAKHALDQTSVVETKEASDITCGVKMTSYFNLMIRPYHPNNNLMKELNHLSVCLDELRAGELGKLGDSLASRFLALHTAANEGTWKAAQFLELHPLEATQGAPASLLLEARKHGRLVSKAQGGEEWRRPRQEGDSWQGSGKGGGNKGKGRGKGKDWPRPGKGEGNWQGRNSWNKGAGGGNWWASQKEKPENKEAKPAEKDPKK